MRPTKATSATIDHAFRRGIEWTIPPALRRFAAQGPPAEAPGSGRYWSAAQVARLSALIVELSPARCEK